MSTRPAHRTTRSAVAALTAAGLAGAGLSVVTALPAQAAPAAAAAARGTTPTHYALQASGYSTRVKGGNVPVNSGRTAFQVIGCTNKAGLSKGSSQANLNVDVLGGLHVSAARTHVWTKQKNNVVSSYANNHIAKVTLGSAGPAGVGVVVLRGINSRSRTWHDGSGFHARTKATVAKIKVGGVEVVPPQSGGSIDLGEVTLTLGNSKKSHDRQGASAKLDAIKLVVNDTNTKVYLAHSRSTIAGGVKSGLFHGSAYAAKAQALADTAAVGRTPLIVMPCQGTNGDVRRRHVAEVTALGSITGLTATEEADQTRRSAYGHETGRVARVSLTKGRRTLVIRGIVGKANVYYSRGDGITKDTKGSHVGRIRLNGKPLQLNANGNLTIENLVRLETHIVKRTKRAIKITELRLTLLGNGANVGATADLGYAKVGFTKSRF